MSGPLRLRTILWFWLPLAATWLMMSVEGPYLSAIVARMEAPVLNLAAFGLAFSLAWLAESPVLMLLSASTALVGDLASYRAFRRFHFVLNGAMTLFLLVLVSPPAFHLLADRVMGLPPEVSRLAHQATALLLPWPAAIGYRRFYQGILVRNHLTRRVAYGTVVRLAAMSLSAALLALASPLPGACIGALALSSGVVAEAAASRWMARHLVRALHLPGPGTAPGPRQRDLARFYFPLALTSMITMATGPLLTFFMGRGPHPVECLAAWPVVNAFIFFFRSGGIAFQEVGVALGGEGERVRRAAQGLALCTTLLLVLVLATPLADLWFRSVLGLEPGLLPFVVLPARLLVLLPALEYLLSLQRSRCILARRTRRVTAATALEAGGLALGMTYLVFGRGLSGTLAAALSLTFGRLAANLTLGALGRRA